MSLRYVVLLALAAASSAGAAQAQANARSADAPCYKYAQLAFLGEGYAETAVWSETGVEERAANLFELYRRLGGTAGERELVVAHFLDLKGQQGWRVASADVEPSTSLDLPERATYLLEREAPCPE